jgi:hypothetical protein
MSMGLDLSVRHVEKILDDQLKEHPEFKYLDDDLDDFLKFVLETVRIMINENNSLIVDNIERRFGKL